MQSVHDYLVLHLAQAADVPDGPELTIFQLERSAVSLGRQALSAVPLDSDKGRECKLILDATFLLLTACTELLGDEVEEEYRTRSAGIIMPAMQCIIKIITD